MGNIQKCQGKVPGWYILQIESSWKLLENLNFQLDQGDDKKRDAKFNQNASKLPASILV